MVARKIMLARRMVAGPALGASRESPGKYSTWSWQPLARRRRGLPPIPDTPSSFGQKELSVLRLQRYTRDRWRQIAAQAGLHVIRSWIPACELARRKLPPKVGCGLRRSGSLRQHREEGR